MGRTGDVGGEAGTGAEDETIGRCLEARDGSLDAGRC
jgi:hypothetical protein